MRIHTIESYTEAEAKALAEEMLVIKEHNVYFVTFDDAFGYSVLVFKNGHHIHYANDYQLHHEWMVKEKGKEALRQWYIDTLTNKLFTEDEITGPIKDYDEYDAKSRYLHNYYAMQEDYVSCFHWVNDKKEHEAYEKAIKGKHLNPIGFCYMDNKDFIKHHVSLYQQLEAQKAKLSDNYEYYKKAFMNEMYNHEYCINLQADYDTLSAFGNLHYLRGYDEENIDAYFDQLEFTETQRRAYYDARKEYLQKAVA